MKGLVVSFCLASSLALSLSACNPRAVQGEDSSNLTGFYNPTSLWSNKALSVCWVSGGFEVEKEWVKQKVLSTWQKHSALSFVGWNACTNANSDISIQIADVGPYTQGLGSMLKQSRPGMVLNFTFENWSPSCQSTRKSCIESIAVHEFGHAIGLSHEHNRDDRFFDCTEDRQGGYLNDKKFGPFDADSIMNYCYNSSYNDGLSAGDIRVVQYLYGAPQSDTAASRGSAGTISASQTPSSDKRFGPFEDNIEAQHLTTLEAKYGSLVSFDIAFDIEDGKEDCENDYLLAEWPGKYIKLCGKRSYRISNYPTPIKFTFHSDKYVTSQSVSITNIQYSNAANAAAEMEEIKGEGE